MSQPQDPDPPLTIDFGHDELVIRDRYETLSIANDTMIALFFVAGSVMFLFPSLETLAIWMFIIGSIEFLMRPAIRLSRRFHLRKVGSGPTATSQDF